MNKFGYISCTLAACALALVLATPGSAAAAGGDRYQAAGEPPDRGWDRNGPSEKAWKEEMQKRGKDLRERDGRPDRREERFDRKRDRRPEDRMDRRKDDRRFDDRRPDGRLEDGRRDGRFEQRPDRRYDDRGHHREDHRRGEHWRDSRSYYDGSHHNYHAGRHH